MRGSIRQRSAGSFEIRIDLDRIDGKRKRRFVSFKGTRKEAQRKLTELLAAGDAGTLTDPTQVTVGAYVAAYLDNATHLSPKTLERYREIAAHQIKHLAETKLQKLKPEHLEAWHATLSRAGLSARTISHAHRLLASVLARAVENGVIARNVAAIRKPPRVEAEEIEILSPDQIAAALAALNGSQLYPIVALALATGMRRGELLGLKWSDVDLDKAVIRVERSLEETRAGGLRLKPPKTKRGRRSIGLPGDTVAMLRAHKIAQLESRFKLGAKAPLFVFCHVDTAEADPLSPNNVTRAWHRACRRAGLPTTSFHALRHAHASQLIAAGVDILTISRRLGHAQAAITLNCDAHLISGGDEAAVKALEGMK